MTEENIINVTDPKQFENMKYFQKYSFNCKNCGSFETRSFRRSHIKAHETLLCQKCLNVLWHGSVSPFSRSEVQEKSRKVMMEKYGAPTGLQSKTIREKINKTNLERHGSKCSLRDPEVFAKAKETTQQKYGVDYALQSKEIYNKTVETLKERYGVDNPFKSEEVRDKSKETLLEKYNVDNPMKSKEIQEKAKQTCLDKYGVDNAFKSSDIRERISQTCLDKYGVEIYACSDDFKEKYKNTCLSKYGKETYFGSDDCLEKTKETVMDRYGVDNPMKSPDIQEKSRKTCIEKYSNATYFGSDDFKEKSKESCLKKYGVPHISMTNENKEKIKQTCIERYNNVTYLGSEEYYDLMEQKYGCRRSPTFKYNHYGMYFDSTPELAVWIYCIDHNIPIMRKVCKFTYYYHNKIHSYYPDFMINGQLVEIKGDQYIDKETGKWIFPYTKLHNNSDKLSVEEKEYYDNLYEVKRQCALSNGVKILYSSECQLYIDYCNQYYPNWDIIYRKDNIYNPSYWCYYINNTYIPNYYNNSNYSKGIGISPYDIDSNDEYTICKDSKGISPFDINKNSE